MSLASTMGSSANVNCNNLSDRGNDGSPKSVPDNDGSTVGSKASSSKEHPPASKSSKMN